MVLAIQIVLFLFTLVGVGIVVSTSNIVHAVYALCLTLVGVAGLYVLLMAELLAVVQIMLYAGGVVILLVFGVMMTNRIRGEKMTSGSKNVAVGALISIGLFSVLVYLINQATFKFTTAPGQDQIRKIGISFFSEHVVAFELIAFVLLVALVGAAYLAKMAADE